MASDGGIFDGPQKGYEAQLHGTELVAPLLKDSVLMKLAQTPAKVSNIEDLFGAMTENMNKDRSLFKSVEGMNKDISLAKSDSDKNTFDPIAMVADVMKDMSLFKSDSGKNAFDPSAMLSDMMNMNKDMSLVKSDLGRNTLDPNAMLADMMKKKTEIEQKVTGLSTTTTETIAPATPSVADKSLSMNTELMQMLSGKLDTVISVLESGNDVSSKILKSSRV
jgi:hypothetical protein